MTKKILFRTGLFFQSVLLSTATLAHQQFPDSLEPSKSDRELGLIASKRFDTAIFYSIINEEESGKLNILKSPSIELNSVASNFVNSYLKQNNEDLMKIQERSPSWFKMIDKIFTQQGIPVELKYLAVIESKLKTNAVSHAGAVGPWQFMPATARLLGLKVNSKVDERKNSYKSTVAAGKYLKDLHRMFDDWLLVIAAYNAGPGTVLKAIKKTGSKNFYKIQYHLPLETRLHVKKFIGAHYYFQPEGSETVLTKQELEAFNRKCNEFIAMRNKIVTPPEVITIEITSDAVAQALPLILHSNETTETAKNK